MLYISKLEVEKFRHIREGSTFDIGRNITLIVGKNGTAKSTLLGMLGQNIGFPDKPKGDSIYTSNYNGIELLKLHSLFGSVYKTEISKIFRFSSKHDIPGEHKYKLWLTGDIFKNQEGNEISTSFPAISITRTGDKEDGNLRFVVNSQNRERGAGNFPHPVIYLGLNRLFPLASCKDVEFLQTELDNEEKTYWNDFYKEVLITLSDENIRPAHIEAKGKGRYHSISTDTFDGDSASAGQDNLGQIITAIISFKRLKKELKDKYQGGVLLIDEVDATLHPVAQQLIFKELIKASKDLNLQIIATTHSFTLIEGAFEKYKDHTKVIYLVNKDNEITVCKNPSFFLIKSNLSAEVPKLKESKKIGVLLEDKLALDFFKKATKNVFSDLLKPETYSTSSNVLKQIAEIAEKKKIPELKKLIFILDADKRDEIANSRYKNLISLPGNNAIEKMLYFFLKSEKEDNSTFYTDILTKDSLFVGYNNFSESNVIDDFKHWYSNASDVSKRELRDILKYWVSKNENECRNFTLQVLETIKKVNLDLYNIYKDSIERKINKKFSL